MTEQDVRRIIQEELSKFSFSDRFFIYKNMQFADGVSIQTGLTNGLKIGTSSSELLSFYGVTPVNKPDTVSDAATQGGTYNQTNVQSIADAVNTVIDRLQELGLLT